MVAIVSRISPGSSRFNHQYVEGNNMASGIAAVKRLIIAGLVAVVLWYVAHAWILPMLGVSN